MVTSLKPVKMHNLEEWYRDILGRTDRLVKKHLQNQSYPLCKRTKKEIIRLQKFPNGTYFKIVPN